MFLRVRGQAVQGLGFWSWLRARMGKMPGDPTHLEIPVATKISEPCPDGAAAHCLQHITRESYPNHAFVSGQVVLSEVSGFRVSVL